MESPLHIVVLSGAGISAESGIKTFRDSDGLWEEYRVEEVATPEAWKNNPALVQAFYNERRAQIHAAQPNAAHRMVAELESSYQVTVVTQNIDDLHERAGSQRIIHLHGKIGEARCEFDREVVVPIVGDALHMGECCPDGHQLRPNIVWFGEDVPLLSEAEEIVRQANVLLIIGTSLSVYPAAGLIWSVPILADVVVIDPNPDIAIPTSRPITHICAGASAGMSVFKEWLKTKRIP
ncbi:MAG: SIR2 family NAD-dependent protein deacylase [Flavobacteriales bacterium]